MDNQNPLEQYAQGFVRDWLAQNPVDYFWRKKYNVPFGSRAHREMTLVDMVIDLEEEKFVRSLRENAENNVSEDEFEGLSLGDLQPANQSGKQIIKLSKKEVEAEYESLNLDEFDDLPVAKGPVSEDEFQDDKFSITSENDE